MDKEGLPKVVVLGGGTGMPVLLKGLKEYPLELAAIVTVADDGGSTGEIRKEMNMPAPGDIRKVIASLAQVDDELKALFQHRFQVDNQLSNHSVGNLVLAAMNSLTDDFYEAVDKVSELFQVKGSIFPIVNESIELHARLMDGTVISGESNIPVKNKKIQEIFITPEKVTPNPKVVQAIQEADLVVISPGSLYTSILPNMIIGGVTEAIRQTKANVVYVSNVMGQLGETEHYTTADHVEAIYHHIGKDTIDTIVLHNQPIDKDILALYKEERSVPVPYDRERLRSYQIRIIEKDVIDYTDNVIRHNPAVLSEILFNLARE
ncbi:MAG TPA: YvcK family protein [Pseudogracilibacillus sp.]|nr:YvcK family protein [Pseudogracilibacillus sp.]